MPANKTETIDLPAPYPVVFNAAARAMAACKWDVRESSMAAGRLFAIKGANLLTWGEKITVTLQQAEHGTRLTINSACRGIQMVDYGRNKANITRFQDALRAALQEPTPEPTAGGFRARFCAMCGGPVRPGLRFCTGCGARQSA